MPLFTPTNQKRLTNVAVVRLRKAGKRFEIACYPNKVTAWRDHVEKDLDEVLQARSVFVNVSKGEGAKKEELAKAFGHEDINKICIEILEKGELQVSAKEREEKMDSQFKDVATLVASKCINPVTKKPYTVSTIEQAMKDCHLALRPNRNSKQLALDAIRKLKDSGLKIQRARMRLSVTVSGRALVDKIRPLAFKIESESYSDETRVTTCILLCDPGNFRAIDELVTSKGNKDATMVSKLEIIDLQVPLDDEEDDDNDESADVYQPQDDKEKGKGGKKKSNKPQLKGDNDDPLPRSTRKHQELNEDEFAVQESTKGGKTVNKGKKTSNKKDGVADSENSDHRRGARGKFVDLADED